MFGSGQLWGGSRSQSAEQRFKPKTHTNASREPEPALWSRCLTLRAGNQSCFIPRSCRVGSHQVKSRAQLPRPRVALPPSPPQLQHPLRRWERQPGPSPGRSNAMQRQTASSCPAHPSSARPGFLSSTHPQESSWGRVHLRLLTGSFVLGIISRWVLLTARDCTRPFVFWV